MIERTATPANARMTARAMVPPFFLLVLVLATLSVESVVSVLDGARVRHSASVPERRQTPAQGKELQGWW